MTTGAADVFGRALNNVPTLNDYIDYGKEEIMETCQDLLDLDGSVEMMGVNQFFTFLQFLPGLRRYKL